MRSTQVWRNQRTRPQPCWLLEEVFVDLDDLVGLFGLHADAISDHERGESITVDQDDP
ncbi:MAG: hypothetical protein ACK5KU_01955 [Beutenbergiaceae bacterium]